MTETDYEFMRHGGKRLQVDSAIRDGEGYRISTTYPKKVDIMVKPGAATNLVIHHGLENAPSAVSLYVINHTTDAYEKIGADITVTDTDIIIQFVQLPESPDGQPLELLVRSLI